MKSIATLRIKADCPSARLRSLWKRVSGSNALFSGDPLAPTRNPSAKTNRRTQVETNPAKANLIFRERSDDLMRPLRHVPAGAALAVLSSAASAPLNFLKRLRAVNVRQLFAATLLVGSAFASHATEVTFQFSGVLTSISDFTGILNGQFAVGNSFSGSITYDFNSPEAQGSGPTPAGPDPTLGVYPTAVVHYRAVINGFETESSPGADPGNSIVWNDRLLGTVRDGLVFNSPRDLTVPLFGVDPETVAGTITVGLWDTITHTALSTDGLPSSIDFNAFNIREFSYFNSYLETGRAFGLTGVITNASMVPETGTSAMLLAGLVGLIARRRLARKQ